MLKNESILKLQKLGYLHSLYVKSLVEFGKPFVLPHSDGWILKRQIAGTSLFDGMGPYPIFMCQNWSELKKDMRNIENQLISLSLVTDPFGAYLQKDLSSLFDIARPYKEHFIIDLEQQPKKFVSKSHQRNTRKAFNFVKVEICADMPIRFLDDWVMLYDNLIIRHDIKGITKFSRDAFTKQLETPGMVVFRAISNGEVVGMSLWYIQGNVAYYHLGAYSSLGYQTRASFAIFWRVIEYFSDIKIKWLSLGAGAGLQEKEDGLTRFKKGWATGTRTAFFCGKIFDHQRYQELTLARSINETNYFPAYRAGEFK